MSDNYSIVQSDKTLKTYSAKWKLVDFGKIIEDVSSGNRKLKKSEYQEIGDLPVVDQGQELIAGYTDQEDAVEAKPPYIVFGDHTRIFKEVNFKMALGADGVKLLKIKDQFENECYYKFIYYFFQYLDIPNTGYNRHYKYLKNIKIPLPSLSEQKAIVAKLDRAQRLIDIDREMLAKYDKLIQSVFLEMFGDPVTNPKGWERASFKKLAEIDKETFDPTDFKGSVEYVGLNSIVKDSGKIIDVETITEGDVKSNKYRFSPDHILYGKLRPYLNKVAFPDFSGVCSTDILPIKARHEISTKYFVGYLLKTKAFVNYADKNSSGANLPRINLKMIKKFEAFLPPLELQKKFDDLVNKIISEKQQTIKDSKKSEELFSSLVQKAFR